MRKGIVRFIVVAVVSAILVVILLDMSRAYERYKGNKEAAARLAALPEPQRKPAALMAYLAFYWGNAALLPTLCKEQGVDISHYAKAFVARNESDHARAVDAYEQLVGSEQALLALIGSDQGIKKEFTDVLRTIGKSRGDGSVGDGCRAVGKDPDRVLAKMDFREIRTPLWKATGL